MIWPMLHCIVQKPFLSEVLCCEEYWIPRDIRQDYHTSLISNFPFNVDTIQFSVFLTCLRIRLITYIEQFLLSILISGTDPYGCFPENVSSKFCLRRVWLMLQKTFQWTNLDWAPCFILLVTGWPRISGDMREQRRANLDPVNTLYSAPLSTQIISSSLPHPDS